ncbi:hypothetical protein [Sphingomonas sp.]|uniref:hypothetical protein n=1 Tax=Sphingomonas sp. TaxID=28214 RepID=UPI0025ED9988|nr:hypothetical protein [Sphingomonas sp.]
MADDTTTTIDTKASAAESSLVDSAIETAESALDTALAESKSFLSKAQETLTSAAGTAVNAVKEHPIAAAGIAAGAAAAVAGAAYGASKLLSDDDTGTTGSKGAKKKS